MDHRSGRRKTQITDGVPRRRITPYIQVEGLKHASQAEPNANLMHWRLSRIRGKPSQCENCRTIEAKRFEWALHTPRLWDEDAQAFYSRDVMDYWRLCVSCHRRIDQGLRTMAMRAWYGI